MFLTNLWYTIVLLLCISDRTASKLHGFKGRGKIAVFWIFTGEPTFYWRWTLATLLNSGAENVDVHMIVGVTAEKLEEYKQQLNNYMHAHKVFFHSISPQQWQSRILSKMDVNITYSIEKLGRKVADFKPCLGDLFQDLIPVKEYTHWVYGDSDGFFGSYDNMLNYNVVPTYDVISGQPQPPLGSEAWSSIPGQWKPLHCAGGWTMIRNTRRINTLYKRALNWKLMLGNPEYRYFDEESPHSESMQALLKSSAADDVRRCCVDSRIPQVLQSRGAIGNVPSENFAILIANIDASYVEKKNSLHVQWSAWSGLTVTVAGSVGSGGSYRNETAQALFMHFLQLKYCCGAELFTAMKTFQDEFDRLHRSVLQLQCFTMHAQAPKRFVFQRC